MWFTDDVLYSWETGPGETILWSRRIFLRHSGHAYKIRVVVSTLWTPVGSENPFLTYKGGPLL